MEPSYLTSEKRFTVSQVITLQMILISKQDCIKPLFCGLDQEQKGYLLLTASQTAFLARSNTLF